MPNPAAMTGGTANTTTMLRLRNDETLETVDAIVPSSLGANLCNTHRAKHSQTASTDLQNLIEVTPSYHWHVIIICIIMFIIKTELNFNFHKRLMPILFQGSLDSALIYNYISVVWLTTLRSKKTKAKKKTKKEKKIAGACEVQALLHSGLQLPTQSAV